jgi:hypothetical protein
VWEIEEEMMKSIINNKTLQLRSGVTEVWRSKEGGMTGRGDRKSDRVIEICSPRHRVLPDGYVVIIEIITDLFSGVLTFDNDNIINNAANNDSNNRGA